ncbi:MAG: GMC family oxidoreductase N-terminal domain-containing protein, partial [Spongiibacteraceae bacterium]|nr:GMC family oxidoreductase N-terminal domain-containing protein [Spongiibacteraceae bacterium]
MTHDIIVVGGGSAGCAMAGRLSEAGLKVLLLEAGKSDKHYRLQIPALTSSVVQHPDFDWRYAAEPDPSLNGRINVWCGGKRLGGGSSINGMMFCRGHRWDYQHWCELGADGWSYDDLLPFFRRMETNTRGEDAWRGGSGPVTVSDCAIDLPIMEAWLQAAIQAGTPRTDDHNGEHPGEGSDYAQVTQRNGLRSSATGYLTKVANPNTLTLELEAQVTRVVIENGRAVGVEYLKNGQRHTVRSRHGVVVSTGTMGTTRLLMVSGIGPADHLREVGVELVHHLPGLGQNLQEHVGTHLINSVNTPTISSEAYGLPLVKHAFNFALRRRGILTTSVGHVQSYIRTRPDLPAPNIQTTLTALAFDLDKEGKVVLRREPAISTTVCVSRPKSRGTIQLRSADPLAAPVIRHQLLGDPDDVEQLAEGIEFAREMMAQPAIRDLITGEIRPGVSGKELRDYVRMASIPFYHPVGTCRMGKDELAVVDPDLRVHGLGGLWVADNSVMPTLP